MLAAVAYWGPSEVGGVGGWFLALALPLIVALVWVRFVNFKSPTRLRDPWLLLLEAAVFGSGVAALADAGLVIWAIVLAVAATVHLALTFPLRQRPQRGT